MEISKVCKRCGVEKAMAEFHKDKGRRDGKRSVCKKCDHAIHEIYVKSNREHLSKYRSDWYRRNVKHMAEKNKTFYLKFRAKRLIDGARKRSVIKGLPFDLDVYRKEIQARIDAGFCEISGVPFNLNDGKTFDSPSIDRIDCKIGYVYTNIRIVCFAMNCALNVWGEEVLWKVMESWMKTRERKT